MQAKETSKKSSLDIKTPANLIIDWCIDIVNLNSNKKKPFIFKVGR